MITEMQQGAVVYIKFQVRLTCVLNVQFTRCALIVRHVGACVGHETQRRLRCLVALESCV